MKYIVLMMMLSELASAKQVIKSIKVSSFKTSVAEVKKVCADFKLIELSSTDKKNKIARFTCRGEK